MPWENLRNSWDIATAVEEGRRPEVAPGMPSWLAMDGVGVGNGGGSMSLCVLVQAMFEKDQGQICFFGWSFLHLCLALLLFLPFVLVSQV